MRETPTTAALSVPADAGVTDTHDWKPNAATQKLAGVAVDLENVGSCTARGRARRGANRCPSLGGQQAARGAVQLTLFHEEAGETTQNWPAELPQLPDTDAPSTISWPDTTVLQDRLRVGPFARGVLPM